jgi:cytochrome c
MAYQRRGLVCSVRDGDAQSVHRINARGVSTVAVALMALVGAVACAQDPSFTDSRIIASSEPPIVREIVDDGRAIAESRCSSCHAVGLSGLSPNPAAPVFRTVLRRYHGQVLAQELIDGMSIAHAPMPVFQFDPKGADALIAYLESIQVKNGFGQNPM